MAFHIHWTQLAESSFADEITFIFKKWNLTEVNKFIAITEDAVNLLTNNPKLGVYSAQRFTYSYFISKQTTLFYKVIPEKNQIDLILFWNNKRNPTELCKLL